MRPDPQFSAQGGDVYDDPVWRRLMRRCVTVPTVLTSLLLLTGLLPLLLPLAGMVDVVRRPRMATRLLCVAWCYLLAETIGILFLTGCWLWTRLIWDRDRRQARLLRGAALAQMYWTASMLAVFCRLFRLRLDITWDDGQQHVLVGPAVVMIRHCSLFDTLLATPLLSKTHGICLRFVLKRELLIDPCLDIAGHILPNYFVRRGGQRSEREIARIRALAGGIGGRDWGLIYPEGTRASDGKRRRALARLQNGDAGLYARASTYRHVIPPQVGGALAMLEGAPHADVVFFAHHGLEGAARMGALWKGKLFERTIHMRLWRVPRAQIPAAFPARVDWLFAQWQEVDAWIAARAAGG